MEYLDFLESEAIYVIREAAAQFHKPAILFSGGKDSLLLIHLAKKAFHPLPIPFPVIHIDTGHNFEETIQFRDQLVKDNKLTLIVGSVQASIDTGKVIEEKGLNASRNTLQSVCLLDTIEENGIDCAFGGGRRDEEKARAKERFFSHRDAFGQWQPTQQRPEFWMLLNGKKQFGEHFRVFPINNWTELDVWQYILKENLEVPSIYFSHQREIIRRKDTLLAYSPYLPIASNENPEILTVRFRTVGDLTCTGAVESTASNVSEIIEEIKAAKTSERGTRHDDKRNEAAMELRKKEGYF